MSILQTFINQKSSEYIGLLGLPIQQRTYIINKD